ncbi:MAG: hypothetical protein A2049_00750 [Elusimicrobia bacterium GWA2_62_23]|nr:MAG: hypothetical protein A2049_00750 [Elusimicrobia bacterium GWA2_62_23]OGR69133.1 MAG: hypothetical protein A2179_04630 [Elusimicrobia bacterium GWC2_63_65]
MAWEIKGWMSGGYMAAREDGELVFIYRRPDWGTGMSGLRAFFELRNRGRLIGRISSENSWRPRIKAEWLAETNRALNEEDLLEITEALSL